MYNVSFGLKGGGRLPAPSKSATEYHISTDNLQKILLIQSLLVGSNFHW